MIDDKLVNLRDLKAVCDSVRDISDSMIAPTEASTTASMAHPAGSYFILSGVLYEATADIASGAAIVTSGTGANCQTVPGGLGSIASELKGTIEKLYTHVTDTDAFYWKPNSRVNSIGTGYTTGQDYYTGLYRSSGVLQRVYPGSTITANPGYTMDYAFSNDNGKVYRRGIPSGETIVITGYGYLMVSVTDGVTDTSTAAAAKAVAKAGLAIDLVLGLITDDVYTKAETDAQIAAQAVRYDVSQNLTDSEKAQGRANIGAVSDAELQTVSEALGSYVAFTGWVKGYDIVTNVSVGATVDVQNPAQASTMSYGIIPCIAGDRFILTGKSFNNPRLWAWTDGDYKLLAKSANGANVTDLQLTAPADGYLIVNIVTASAHSLTQYTVNTGMASDVAALKSDVAELQEAALKSKSDNDLSALVDAQKSIAADWRFAFINVSGGMGLGSKHVIPGTATLWGSGTSDLTQKDIWMSDGTHPFKGSGVTDMYAHTISAQMAMVVPSYRDGVGETSPSVWAGRRILWMGTSIPAGSDPEAGEGTGSTYPALIATLLGASSINKAKGSSCVRINASTGEYTGMIFPHFARALTRTVAECDEIAASWDSIKSKITYAPSTLSASDVTTMKNHSFENLLLPYLDGTYSMPDLFVIDHGHNDVRPRGIDGENDLWLSPSAQMIADGILAEDTYMTANDYANLKTALNDDLTKISDVAAFAATLNRNCFKGAVNFLITLILRYNPYARIAIVSDYN